MIKVPVIFRCLALSSFEHFLHPDKIVYEQGKWHICNYGTGMGTHSICVNLAAYELVYCAVYSFQNVCFVIFLIKNKKYHTAL